MTTKLPAGYVKASLTLPSEEDIEEATSSPAALPGGYKKPKRVYDETNPRPPRHMGPKHICVCCYRGSPTYLDRICPRCMKDRHELAKVEQEIAKEIPPTGRMSSAEIMRRLFQQNKRLLVRIEKLKEILERRTEDINDLTGRVGHR